MLAQMHGSPHKTPAVQLLPRRLASCIRLTSHTAGIDIDLGADLRIGKQRSRAPEFCGFTSDFFKTGRQAGQVFQRCSSSSINNILRELDTFKHAQECPIWTLRTECEQRKWSKSVNTTSERAQAGHEPVFASKTSTGLSDNTVRITLFGRQLRLSGQRRPRQSIRSLTHSFCGNLLSHACR